MLLFIIICFSVGDMTKDMGEGGGGKREAQRDREGEREADTHTQREREKGGREGGGQNSLLLLRFVQ